MLDEGERAAVRCSVLRSEVKLGLEEHLNAQ